MSNPSHSFRRSLEAFSRAVRGGGACATLCLGALALGTGCSAEAEIPEVTVKESVVEAFGKRVACEPYSATLYTLEVRP